MDKTITKGPLKNHINKFLDHTKNANSESGISKAVIWKVLQMNLPEGFVFDDENTKIIYSIIRYFNKQDDFNEYELFINTPSLKKGLYVFGNNGVGKSWLFNLLQKTGDQLYYYLGWQGMRFKSISCRSFIEDYMEAAKKPNFHFDLKKYYSGPLHLQDLGFEEKAFGSKELMATILFERHRKGSLTFVDSNMKPSEITERYGNVIGDRMPEMFNIIHWTGKSRRHDLA